MDGILKCNDCDVNTNPPFGSHDPSMMWDPETKRYYSYCTDIYMPDCGLNKKRGIPVRVSGDLVSFTYQGIVLSEKAIREARDNGTYPTTWNFWAPFTEYANGEYRMYYSATRAFGSSESRIWLAVSDNPLGPFENRGVVMDTWGTDDTYPNAIDPHIIRAEERPYLVYGSFFGGIYIKELDDSTGMPKNADCKTLGTCISRKAKKPRIDGPEGASVIYHSESGYYYLFQSYGWLGDNYDIRVGRSRCVSGPYLDWNGKNLVEESMGLKLANSYYFQAEKPNAIQNGNGWKWAGFRGPGHGVPFYDVNTGRYYFVHHIRDGAKIYQNYDEKENRESYSVHALMIRRMFFKDGWPILSPEPYAEVDEEPITSAEAAGRWEMLFLTDEDNKQKISEEMIIAQDSEYFKNGILHTCWDFENSRKCTAISGISKEGIAYWGKNMR